MLVYPVAGFAVKEFLFYQQVIAGCAFQVGTSVQCSVFEQRNNTGEHTDSIQANALPVKLSGKITISVQGE